MKKLLLLAVMLSVSILALLPSGAYAAGAKKNPGTTTETYLVLKIVGESEASGRGSGKIDSNKVDSNTEPKIEYKVVATSRYKDEEKRIKDAYATKIKEWKDLRKIEPGTPMPVKPTIKKMGNTTFQTQKVAQEYADKLKDEESDKDESKPNTTRK